MADKFGWDNNFGNNPAPTPRQLSELIARIKEALNTEEDGANLVEVARNAHRAELELPKALQVIREMIGVMQKIIDKP